MLQLQNLHKPLDIRERTAPELEVFYTFTWAPRPRGNRRPQRGEHQGQAGQDQGQGQGRGPQGARAERGPRRDGKPGEGRNSDGKPGEGRFGGEGKRSGGGPKGKPKGKPPRHDGPKSFEARPPRAEKKIDPDSPFAILASLKNKT